MRIKFFNYEEAQKRAAVPSKTFIPYFHDFLRCIILECNDQVQADSIHLLQHTTNAFKFDLPNAEKISHDVVANVLGYESWKSYLAYHRKEIYRPYSSDESDDVSFEKLESIRAEQASNLLEVLGKHDLTFCGMDIGHCRDFVDFWQPTAKRTDQNALTQKLCRYPELWADETSEIRCVVDSLQVQHLTSEPQLSFDQATILKDWIHRTDDPQIQYFWNLSRSAAWNSYKSTIGSDSKRAADLVLSALAATEDKVAMGLLAILRFSLYQPESIQAAFNYAKGASEVLANFAAEDAVTLCQVGHLSAVLLRGPLTPAKSSYSEWVIWWENSWRERSADTAACDRMIRQHRRCILRQLPESKELLSRKQVFLFSSEATLMTNNEANLWPRWSPLTAPLHRRFKLVAQMTKKENLSC